MTSYSTHGVGRIRLVDGDLSPDEETREEQFEQIVDCLAAGVCRALLDQARDLSDDDADVYAEQWHSADQGWELDALDDDARSAVQELVRRFATENLADVLTLAEFIAWDAPASGELWHGDSGMGMYRVGYLLGMEGAGQGIGFRDYSYPGCTMAPDRLSAWLDRQDGGHPFEGAYVDGTEEPCLLHLS